MLPAVEPTPMILAMAAATTAAQDLGKVYSSGPSWLTDTAGQADAWILGVWHPGSTMGHSGIRPAGQQPYCLCYSAFPDGEASGGNPYAEFSALLGVHLHAKNQIWRGDLLTCFPSYSLSLRPNLGPQVPQ